jgi:hypothetical protein
MIFGVQCSVFSFQFSVFGFRWVDWGSERTVESKGSPGIPDAEGQKS